MVFNANAEDIDRFKGYLGTPFEQFNRDECVIWKGAKLKTGYGTFTLNDKSIYAHRFSYFCFVGDFSPELKVCHKCDNPPCVNPFHLWIGTQKDNLRDMIRKHRKNPARGESVGVSKLTNEKVLEIRHRALNETYLSLARDFNVTFQQVSNICRGLQWKHVGGPISEQRRM